VQAISKQLAHVHFRGKADDNPRQRARHRSSRHEEWRGANVEFDQAHVAHRISHVRFTPKSRHRATRRACPLCAKSGHSHCSKKHRYSITSSASAINVGGMSSALPLLRLMTRSKVVGSSTGTSAGFVPRRILSTWSAACSKCRQIFKPCDTRAEASTNA